MKTRFRRAGGILLHPTSLPSGYGIGDLGPEAHKFVEWLASAGCSLWQVLPLGPTGYGNSPYQCHSVFAGNPYLISPELLVRDGLIKVADLGLSPDFSPEAGQATTHVDFERLIPRKLSLLEVAYARFKRSATSALKAEFARFRSENGAWLDDYCLFMALKEQHGGGSWIDWPLPFRRRDYAALRKARPSLGEAINCCAFAQMLFFRQWRELRAHARRFGIRVIGDVPIFAAEDSADVWGHPELFCLDAGGLPSFVAGVPPDYFAPTGQLWGNPLYHWEIHQRTHYAWWLDRMRAALKLADAVRLDHFRGFAGYWEVAAGAATAEVGRWAPGPGSHLLDAVAGALRSGLSSESMPIIAEDLGVITPDVMQLLIRYQLPGMRILQFGFAGVNDDFLPHNYPVDCVAYTGTHDNDTTRGWFASASKIERRTALDYLHSTDAALVADMIKAVWASAAASAIVPMQDLLDLGSEARMNYPGRPEGNWSWRLGPGHLTSSLAGRLRELNQECGRLSRASRTAPR